MDLYRFRSWVTVWRLRPRIVLLGSLLFVVACSERPGIAADRSDRFSDILNRHTRTTFRAVADYLKQHPQADDADRAYRWLFETAKKQGLEVDALAWAQRYLHRENGHSENLHRENQSQTVTALARLVHGVGLAKTGRMKEALVDFDAHLRSARLRSANSSIDFAVLLSAQAQLTGDFRSVRNIWERLASKFFLNPYVRRYCDTKLKKLQLVGKPAPRIGGSDLQGKPIRLTDHRGQVVLVDFWGTNCPPCLAAFPDMKQMATDLGPKGLETLGISLDKNPDVVNEFQKKWKLPWRLAVGESQPGGNLDRYNVVTIPSSFLIDQQGNIAYVDLMGEDLRQAVEKLLKRKPKGR